MMIEPETQFEMLARISRRLLLLRDFTAPEQRVGEIIIECSFERGRDSAVIPSLAAFADLTGMSRTNACRGINSLIERGAVVRRGSKDFPRYTFIPSLDFWWPKLRGARWREIVRLNDEPDNQLLLPLPADEPGLVEGAIDASFDAANEQFCPVAECATHVPVADSGIRNAPGKTLLGDEERKKEAKKERRTKRFVTLRNVADVGDQTAQRRCFLDPERNHIFDQLEAIADGRDFRQYRGKWINRVREFPTIVREAVGDVKAFRANPRNRLNKPAGAMIFRRCQELARAAGKAFHLC